MSLKRLLLAIFAGVCCVSCHRTSPPPSPDSILKLPPQFTLQDAEPNLKISLPLLSGPRFILTFPLNRVNTDAFPCRLEEKDFDGKSISVFGDFKLQLYDLRFYDRLSFESRKMIDDYHLDKRSEVFVVPYLWLAFRDDKLVEITVNFKFSSGVTPNEQVQFVQDLSQAIIADYGSDLVLYNDFGQRALGTEQLEGRLWLVDETNKNNALLSWDQEDKILQYSILAGDYDDSSIRQYWREHRGSG